MCTPCRSHSTCCHSCTCKPVSQCIKRRRLKTVLCQLAIATVLLYISYIVLKYIVHVTGITQNVEPQALLGYFHCSINDTEIHQFPCDFNPKPNTSDVLFVTFINAAWLPLAKNWICSARKVGLKEKLYLIALQPDICSKLPSDIPCYEHTSVDIQSSTFGHPNYRKLMIERTRLILKLLNCGQHIVLVDADVVFLKNPLGYLKNVALDKDILFQADSIAVYAIDVLLPHFFQYICGGFIYMKNNHATRYLWRAVLEFQTTFYWNDQAGLNVCIRHHSQFVRWGMLDSTRFPNGQHYFYYNQKNEKNMAVHANHIFHTGKKIERMIGSNIWCDADYAAKLCQNKVSLACDKGREECTTFVEACKQYIYSNYSDTAVMHVV